VFNIFYVENPTSYWAIIVPLFFAVSLLNDAIKNQVLFKTAETAASEEVQVGKKPSRINVALHTPRKTSRKVVEAVFVNGENAVSEDLVKKESRVIKGTARKAVGVTFIIVGAAFVSVIANGQHKVCEEELGACFWARMEPKLYVRKRRSS
jgi:hypothetical protein